MSTRGMTALDNSVLAILVRYPSMDQARRTRLFKRLESKLAKDVAKLLQSPDRPAPAEARKEVELLKEWASSLPPYRPEPDSRVGAIR